MDDDEDFEALFFTECGEMLADLQDQLELLASGQGEDETINAAFRAVHSIKGGAAAFGFENLIAFAHVFETVMDRVRSHELDVDDHVSDILLRASDVMEVLVERTQASSDEPVETLQRVLDELQDLTGSTQKPGGDHSDETAVDKLTEDPDPETNYFRFSVTPGEDFFRSGHDLLRLIRSAREKGLTEVSVSGEIPSILDLDVNKCPLIWIFTFETSEPAHVYLDFMEIYNNCAEIKFLDTNSDSDVVIAEAEDSDHETSSASTDAVKPEPVSSIAQNVRAEPPQKSPLVSKTGRGRASKSLRVELTRIDRLVNLVGEMLITQSGLAQKLDVSTNEDEIELGHSVETLSRQLRELQENVMAIRAQPIKSVFSRMPRVVRDLSEKLDRKAHLKLSGENTEIDSTVIEELAEPLTHMIRNSMDHGLESSEERKAAGKPSTGNIHLSAEHKGERVIIVVEDDGKGINRETVRKKAIEQGLVSKDDKLSPNEIDALIFHPGFSTAQEVSSVSGRGVGMDVVKKKIQSLGGRCVLSSNPGVGTRFAITLPLTLAVMDGMIISVDQQQFILPLSTVIEAVRLEQGDFKQMPDGTSIINRRGEYLRLIGLRSVLNMPAFEGETEMAIIVDSETSGHVALVVDELIGQKQIVLKSLEANYRPIDGVSGATILGDGKVALILDIPSLMAMDSNKGSVEEMVH